MLLGSFKNTISDHPRQVLPTKWVDEAMERWQSDGKNAPMTALGVDVARGGAAKTVLAPRHGTWFGKLHKYKGSETPDGPAVADLCADAVEGDAPINIDVNGVGSSAFDFIKAAGLRSNPVMVMERRGLKSLPGKPKLYNRRTWLYWLLRYLLDPARGFRPSLPPDDKLRDDLITPMYSWVQGGQILVEGKDEIQSRLRRSIDDGDSVILSLYSFFDEAISQRMRPGGESAKVLPMQARFRGGGENQWMLM